MSDPVLRAEGLVRTYGSGEATVHAVREASLTVRAGELVVLRGPSGSGKTTLLNLLGGLDRPDAGSVELEGRDVAGADERELADLRATRLGFVFQSFALLPMLTAAENVEVPLRLVGAEAAARDARVEELLAAVGLSDHADQRPDELSGGQQQRVGIARALANRPGLLIADEPTGQLDSRTAAAMMRLVSELVHREDVAAVVSTHDPRLASFADRVIEMRDGVLRPVGGHAAATPPD